MLPNKEDDIRRRHVLLVAILRYHFIKVYWLIQEHVRNLLYLQFASHLRFPKKTQRQVNYT